MTLSSSMRPVVACALLLALASQASAGNIQFKYDWSPASPFVTAGVGKVTFFDEPETEATVVPETSFPTTAAFLKLQRLISDTSRAEFGPSEGFYSLTVTLPDIDSGRVAPLTFNGQLQGRYANYFSAVKNYFFSPTSQSILLGNHEYTVTLFYGGVFAPDYPDHVRTGFRASISVRDVKETPEPSSLALLGLGAIGLAGHRWRRWRAGRSGAIA